MACLQLSSHSTWHFASLVWLHTVESESFTKIFGYIASTMRPDTGWERLWRVQNALLAVCLTLSAIFLVNLYRVRTRMIKLKNQGLVSRVLKLRISLKHLTSCSACHPIIQSLAIYSWSIDFSLSSHEICIFNVFQVKLDEKFQMSDRFSISICGRSLFRSSWFHLLPPHINSLRNAHHQKRRVFEGLCVRWRKMKIW